MSSTSSNSYRISLVRTFLIGCAFVLLGQPAHSWANTDDGERAQLAAVVRQVDQIEQQVRQASAIPQERSRYHLDYTRVQSDLQRIRNGLQDYLTPPRAQPREITPLSANYQLDAGAPAVSALQRQERKP